MPFISIIPHRTAASFGLRPAKFPTAVFLLFVLLQGMAGFGDRFFADYYYIPPPTQNEKERTQVDHDRRYPLPESQVRAYASAAIPELRIHDFQGGTPLEKQLMEEASPNQVAFGKALHETAPDLFGSPLVEGGAHIFLAAIVSEGAQALRVKVDLTGLLPEEELWVLDGEGEAAFGPYTLAHALPAGNWLPTTVGSRTVLALRTPKDVCPLLVLEGVSHFFKSIFSESLPEPEPCHLPMSGETNPDALAVAAGVGILIIPYGLTQGFCTGTLLNTLEPASLPPDPYLIGAWHCFDDDVQYDGVEVFWDYRSEEDDPTALLRNTGAVLIDHNLTLDAALLKLTGPVGVGPHGRTWVGWDTQQPVKEAPVQVIHHPVASSLKTSRGIITAPTARVCRNTLCTAAYEKQVEVRWTEGITEAGSSGSPLLFRDNRYRIIGMLSNGTDHSCRSSDNNFDNFASFAYFFPQVKCHLVPGENCSDPYAPEGGSCFLARLFGFKASTLERVRLFRDRVLSPSDWGRQCITDYYAFSPTLEQWLRGDLIARELFRAAVYGAAAWGGSM